MDELPFPRTLSKLQKEHLRRVAETLSNMGVRFGIEEPDGALHGNATLQPPPTKRNRIAAILGHGVMTKYIGPLVDDMKPGMSRVIYPPEFYPAEWSLHERTKHLQRAITSYCSNKWGNKSYRTESHEDQATVELLRTEVPDDPANG